MTTMYSLKIKKFTIALLLVGVTHIALGSFTGTSYKKSSDLYSLKNFNKNFFRGSSLFSLKSGFEYKNTRFIGQTKDANGAITISSMKRFEKGNTTYIYPYVYKINVPKFKTPAPPTIR